MQSPLFAYNDQQSQERYSLQNKQMLRVVLEGHDDMLARKGTMVAFQGLVEFDAEYQNRAGAASRAHTGEGLDLMRCHGQGTVYLANLAQHIHVVDVDQDGLTVDSSYVLAMDSSLHHDVDRRGQPVRDLRLRQVPAQHHRARQGRPDDVGRAADAAGHAGPERQLRRRRDRRLVHEPARTDAGPDPLLRRVPAPRQHR